MKEMIDTADHVMHLPSGEEWVVACVIGDRLSWAGYPEGSALLSDCVLTHKATLEEKQKLLEDMANINTNDHRCRYAREKLKTP